jgi:hypothetical protein
MDINWQTRWYHRSCFVFGASNLNFKELQGLPKRD